MLRSDKEERGKGKSFVGMGARKKRVFFRKEEWNGTR